MLPPAEYRDIYPGAFASHVSVTGEPTEYAHCGHCMEEGGMCVPHVVYVHSSACPQCKNGLHDATHLPKN